MSVLVFRSATTSKCAKRMVRKTTQKSQISKKDDEYFLYTPSKSHYNQDTGPATICKMCKSIEPDKYGLDS